MTFPDPTAPPATIGGQPASANDVNGLVALCLRNFVTSKVAINQNQAWLLGTDLKAAPYYFTSEQETDIKSAIGSLDTALDGIDMTFVSRVLGMV